MSKDNAVRTINSSKYDDIMKKIYFADNEVQKQKERYLQILELFSSLYDSDS